MEGCAAVQALPCHRGVADCGGRRFAAGHPRRRHGAGLHADYSHLHLERHHGVAGAFDAVAFLRHARARHRGMSDPGRRHEADCALANLAGQMARSRDSERGVAGDCRRVCFRAAAISRIEAPGGRAAKFARTNSGGARFGERGGQQGGNRGGDSPHIQESDGHGGSGKGRRAGGKKNDP